MTNVDKFAPALALGQEMHVLNAVDPTVSSFIHSNIWPFLDSELEQCKEYDIVILDPPEYAIEPDKSGEIELRYRKLNALGARLVRRDEGLLVTSCCSHGFSGDDFRRVVEETMNSLPVNWDVIWESGPPPDHITSELDPTLSYLTILMLKLRPQKW